MSKSLSSRLSNASYEFSDIPFKTRKERIIVLKSEQKSNKKKMPEKKYPIRTVNFCRETRHTNLTPENDECKNLKQ